MKHGPNALIDVNLPVVIIATRDPKDVLSMTRYEKTCSNLKEVKARSKSSRWPPKATTTSKPPTMCCTFHRRRKVAADSRNRAPAVTGVSHRRAPRLRRGWPGTWRSR
jgi:hypothetical protein